MAENALVNVRIVDEDGQEVGRVTTDIVSLPDHPDFKQPDFKGLVDALVSLYRAQPQLTRIEVDFVKGK